VECQRKLGKISTSIGDHESGLGDDPDGILLHLPEMREHQGVSPRPGLKQLAGYFLGA
jgi:hypothetical protein